MEPTLVQLRYFVAVAEERSFTRAAAREHLSQQALSSAIAALETVLEVPLVTRSTRHVALTEAGETLLAGARELLGDAARLWPQVHAAAGRSLSLRVGVSPAVSSDEATAALQGWAAERSALDISSHSGPLAHLLARLRSGELDVLLMRYPPEDSDGLASSAIGSRALRLAVGPRHRLRDHTAASLADIAQDRLLAWGVPRRSPFAARVRALCAAAGFEPTFLQTTSTGATALLPVARNEAVALIAEGHHAPAGVRLLQVLDHDAQVPLTAVWLVTRPPPVATAAPRL